MKKLFVLISLITLSFVLSGCGKEEQLTCTLNQKETGMEALSTISAEFKNNEVKHMSVKVEMTVEDKYKNYMEPMKKSVEESWQKYNKKGIDLDISINESTIVAKADFNLEKISKEDKEDLDIMNVRQSKADAIKELEAEGYTCK